jgi:RHS repeat-associated protein
MKMMRFLIFVMLGVATLSGSGQINPPGRVQTFVLCPSAGIVGINNALVSPAIGGSPQNISSGPNYAEAITPDIQALANGLQDNPLLIFKYVHDHIKFVLYYGSMKGAELTLLEQSGNDFDQCALLSALLQAAGYSPSYQFSMLEMPYSATDGTQNDLQHWLGLTLANTNWTATSDLIGTLLGSRGYPVVQDMGDNNDVAFQRIWVTVTIGGTNYLLDPAFKVSEPVSGINLASAMGLSSNALMSAAAGTDTGNYATNLNETNLRNTLTGYTTNLLGYLQSNCPNASVQQILGGSQILPYANGDLGEAMIFTNLVNPGNNYPELSWTYEPTNFMSTFSVTINTTNETFYFPQLQGQGLSLSFNSVGTASLWLGDSVILQTTNTGSGLSTTVTLGAYHPFNLWNIGSNTPGDAGYYDQSLSRSYQRTNANYAIMYSFEPSVKWLNAQEQQLDIYQSEGYSNTSPQVVNATLNVMGMEWMVQTALAQDILCQQAGLLPEYHHRIGRMAQETGHGYYVDVYMQQDGTLPATGVGTNDIDNLDTVFDVSSYIWSAMEHGIIQQLQNSNLVAASTVKILQIANTNQQAVFLASSTNWSTVLPKLVNYNSATNTLATLIGEGYYLLLPQNGAIPVAGSSSWTGQGYVELLVSGNQRFSGMIIGGGYNGGYVSDPDSFVNPDFTELTVDNQPEYFDIAPISTPTPTIADPVDTADGTFQVENTDLSLGQAAPRGIALSRYYNGTRRFSSAGGMTGGWINNYSITADNVAAPQAGLGSTTPAQMASMLVATCAAYNLYNNLQPDPKNWMVTALIAKWGVDQLIANGVSVNLGQDTLQFVQQPNGVFTPPANCTAALTQSGSAYSLLMRHGNKFNFNAAGNLTNIVDQYGQSLNLTYNASNWVSTIKDWKSRTLTFTYSGTPSRLASVSDGTRTVSYGYSTAYSPQGDLVSFTDPEGKTSTYQYNTNHQITATIDALDRLVVSNVYDSQGHITTQYTEGSTNQTWSIFWSGWQTTEFDPAGDESDYLYDDLGRLVGQRDALSNLTQMVYDGQNHIVQTVSPLDETNESIYDGNNNLVETIDPLGFTNQLVYDSNNNLIRSVDARGNPSTFGYNTEFSMTGQTNGAGDFVNYVYTTTGSLVGTLASRTDSGGTTTYGYDSYGQLSSIIYPNGLGTNNFVNNIFGDATTNTDERGFATIFQYNNRRQLTNSIAPTNLVMRIAYDPVGNQSSATDPRGNVTSNTWSATHMLLATTMPPTPQGTPVVTNFYDNRDWLVGTLDPLQHQTLYTNDADERLISTTDPLLRTTTFGYDDDSREIAATNDAHEATTKTWDARSEMIQLTDGAGHTSSRTYDGAGDQIILTNRNGNPWHFYFDQANRLTNTVSPKGFSTTVTFNHQGLPSMVIDPATNRTTYYYDAKGRLTNRSDNVATTLYHYDANNNLTNVAESGLTNAWTYDAYNRASSYQDIYGNVIQYRYDANGNMTNLIYPGGHNVYYAYDSNNHLTNVVDWSGRKTSIGYDLDGRLTSIVRPNGTYRTITYDVDGEATNILEQNALGFPIALFRYNWNANATMQWEFAAPLPPTSALPTRTMTYDADNRLATVDGNPVSLDNNGNLLSGPLTNDTFATYAYDARNRLLNVDGVVNAYDAMNNRVGQTDGTNTSIFVMNPNTKLSQMLMRIKNGVTNYYVYGPGLLYQVTEMTTATNTLTYHYDYRGSTIALTADNGNVTDRMSYSLYATMTYRVGTNDTPFLFNGQYGVMTDPNGLLYMRARYYNPFLCRFLNPDPSGFSGGINFYAYANGNPVSYLDPTGLQSWMGAGYGALSGPLSGGLSASYSIPANYTAPNPSGMGTILLDSGVSYFDGIGGGGGTQIIRLDNGQIVSYGYVAVGVGVGKGGGAAGGGEVYNVYQATDYDGPFANVSGGAYVGGSISGQPLPGQNGSASFTAGVSTIGVSGSLQDYWIIGATAPTTSQTPANNSSSQNGWLQTPNGISSQLPSTSPANQSSSSSTDSSTGK